MSLGLPTFFQIIKEGGQSIHSQASGQVPSKVFPIGGGKCFNFLNS